MVLIYIAWITFGSVSVHSGKRIEEHSEQGTAFVKQMAQDWERPSYTDIEVTKEFFCQSGYTELYEGIYHGHTYACDCLGIYHHDVGGANRFNLEDKCDYNQTYHGCRSLNAFPAVL